MTKLLSEEIRSNLNDLAETLIHNTSDSLGSDYDIGYYYGFESTPLPGINDMIVQRRQYCEDPENKYYDYFLGFIDGFNDKHRLI